MAPGQSGRRSLSTWACLLAGEAVLAVPAYPGPFELKQPDGTTVIGRAGGDERFNWVSVDGQLVERGADGYWRYVRSVGGEKQVSGQRAGLDAAPGDVATVANVPALREAACGRRPGCRAGRR